MEQTKSEFQFKGFKILKSFIKIDEDHQKLNDFDFGIDIKGVLNKSTGSFRLYLNMLIHNAESDFICDINSVGIFTINSENQDFIDNYIYTNAPALLFPYLRAYISNLTTQSGIDSVVLPTMNLSRIVQEEFKDKFEIIE